MIGYILILCIVGQALSQTCETNQYLNGTTCEDCLTNCATCDNGTSCSTCVDDYELNTNTSLCEEMSWWDKLPSWLKWILPLALALCCCCCCLGLLSTLLARRKKTVVQQPVYQEEQQIQEPEVQYEEPQIEYQQPQVEYIQPQVQYQQQPQIVYQQPQVQYQPRQIQYQQPRQLPVKRLPVIRRSIVQEPQTISNVTAPSMRFTAPPMRVAAPPMRVAAPPMRVAAPPMRVTAPPVRMTAPPVRVTAPAVRMMASPTRTSIQRTSYTNQVASPTIIRSTLQSYGQNNNGGTLFSTRPITTQNPINRVSSPIKVDSPINSQANLVASNLFSNSPTGKPFQAPDFGVTQSKMFFPDEYN